MKLENCDLDDVCWYSGTPREVLSMIKEEIIQKGIRLCY